MVEMKRAYESASRNDGYRILIDRLWPRGLKKTEFKFNEWTKLLAPSTELRRSFGHEPARWRTFQSRYKAELRTNEAKAKLTELTERARKGKVTLLYSAKDTEHNDAVVLKSLIEKALRRKTTTSKGMGLPKRK
jgi:uncharacterized protein YeaO (DUF488 family)